MEFPNSINIIEILSFGIIGLGFLLAFMAYRLLALEQNRARTRGNMLRAVYFFMAFSIVLSIIGFASEILRDDDSSIEQPPDSTPDVKATVAKIVSATLASQPTPPMPDVKATVAEIVSATLASQPTPPIPDAKATVTAAVATALASQPTPTFTPMPTPTVTKTPISHRVTKGENLWCISERYYGQGSGSFFEELCAHNRLIIGADCTIIQPGQELTIPTNEDYTQLPQLRIPFGVRGKDYFCVDADAQGKD